MLNNSLVGKRAGADVGGHTYPG